MPFKSEAQRRLFHAMASRGEISPSTVEEWEHATKNKKSLPYHAKKKANILDEYPTLSRFKKIAALTPTQQMANAIIQGGSSLALNAAMSPPGERLRQGLIGAASEGLGGYVGGFKGMGTSLATNMALQHLTQRQPATYTERYASLLYKAGDHADDRLKERIKKDLSPDALKNLREQVSTLTVPAGKYYFNLQDVHGNPAAVAAFKTVGKNNRLVLATVLHPKGRPPPGTSLGHLLKQPKENLKTSRFSK